MEVLVLDGKKYIKASKAAKDLGYTSDYVGQLCRAGKVGAHLIGRSWYVDQDELSTHKTEKKRMSRVKSREQAKKSIEEHRVKINTPRKNYKNIAISYEEDDADLIPETRKVEVESQIEKQLKQKKKRTSPRDHSIENEGKKIIMSGNVSIVDVSDGVPDPHTTILKPTILTSDETALEKEKHEKEEAKKAEKLRKENTRVLEVEEGKVEDEAPEETLEKSDFISRLEEADAIPEEDDFFSSEQPDTIEEGDFYDTYPEDITEDGNSSFLPLLVVVLITVGVLLSISTSRIAVYTAESVIPVAESLNFDISETILLLQEVF